MPLSDAQLREFKALYLARFGVALPDEEAHGKAVDLIEAVRLIYRLDVGPLTVGGYQTKGEQRAWRTCNP